MKLPGKRALTLLVSLVLLLTMLPQLQLPAAAEVEPISGTCGNEVSWSLSGGTLTINGIGAMEKYSSASDAPWYSVRSSIKAVTIGNGITEIGYKAFSACGNLTSVIIPDTVTTVGGYAFYRCTALTSITLPESVTVIREFAFYQCTGLTSVIIPERVSDIGSHAFDGCGKLSLVSFLGSAPTLADACFSNVNAMINYPCSDNAWANATKESDNGQIIWKEKHCYVNGVCTVCGGLQDVMNYGGCGSNLQWQLDDAGTLIVTGTGAMANYYSAYATPWNSVRSSIRALEIRNGVTTIGQYAFSACSNLTTVTIADSVTDIGIFAFKDCKSLISVDLPAGLTTIRKGTFYNCGSLVSVTIPEGVEEILGDVEGDKKLYDYVGAFENCTGLTSIRLPKSVTEIGECTFANCTNLISIVIPENVVSVGYGVFETVDNAKVVVFLGPVLDLDSSCFSESTATAYYPCGDDTWDNAIKFTYGGFVTWKAWHTFDEKGCCINCGGGRELVVNMNDYCYGTRNGASIDIYQNEKYLEDVRPYSKASDHATLSYASAKSYRLCWNSGPNDESCSFSISMNGAVLASGFGADMSDGQNIPLKTTCDHQYEWVTKPATCINEGFTVRLCTGCGDSGMEEIRFATGHSYVGGICTACKDIQDIQSIAGGACGQSVRWQLDQEGTLYITGIGPMENYSRSDMVPWDSHRTSIKAVEIGEGVTSIGSSAFEDCTGLKHVVIPKSVAVIGSCAFGGCKKLEDVTIPEGITTIESGAFIYCESFVSITIPESVTKLGQYAFYGCTGMTQLTIHGGITDIEIYTFASCKGLVEITFGESIKSLGQFALAGCSSLSTITFLGERPSFAGWVFNGVSATVYFPCDKRSWGNGGQYDNVIMQKKHNYVGGVCTVCQDSINPGTGSCGTDLRWQLDTAGTLTISGSGSMENYAVTEESGTPNTPWYPYRLLITKVVIANGITTIGEYAFHGCSNLSDVTIPESVTTIGKLSFYKCTGLTSVTIPRGVTTIGSAAFRRCSNLTDIAIPESVTTIGKIAFFDCTGLTDITIPGSVTQIGEYAFGNCTGLTKVTFVGAAPSLDSTCFKNVTATAAYPCNDATWTDSVKQNYGGTIAWKADHHYENESCAVCGKGEHDNIPGDLDGDGRRTIADVTRLYAHTKGTLPLDSTSLAYADVNGDGDVNIADTARLYAHVTGTNLLIRTTD